MTGRGFALLCDIRIPTDPNAVGSINQNGFSFQGHLSSTDDKITFLCNRSNEDALDIKEVFCSSVRVIKDHLSHICGNLGASYRFFSRMTPSSDDHPAAYFAITTVKTALTTLCDGSGVVLRFLIGADPSIDHFHYQLRDSHFFDDLWSSAVEKDWTDIEFQVGGKTFSAHRTLLALRCPALLRDGSSSAPIRIDDVEPSVFEELLFFVYTGKLKTGPHPSKDLYEAAVIYQVDTLVQLFEMRHTANLFDVLPFAEDEAVAHEVVIDSWVGPPSSPAYDEPDDDEDDFDDHEDMWD